MMFKIDLAKLREKLSEPDPAAEAAMQLSDKIVFVGRDITDGTLIVSLLDAAAQEAFERKVASLPETHPVRAAPMRTKVWPNEIMRIHTPNP